MSIKVFISHSSTDKVEARRLSRDLHAKGIEPWIDEDRLEFGASLPNEIRQAIQAADFVLVLLSPSSTSSDWVLKESEFALEQEKIRGHLIAIPVMISECEMRLFNDRYHVDLTSEDQRQNQLNRLMRKLKGEPILKREFEEALELVDQIELTQLWRKSLSIGSFSKTVQSIIHKSLNSMRPGLDTWNPAVTMSYLSLAVELRDRHIPCKGASELMRKIIEDRSIAPFLRHVTFLTFFAYHKTVLENELILPEIFFRNDDPEFIKEIIDPCIGISKNRNNNTEMEDNQSNREALAKLILSDQAKYRKTVSDAINNRIHELGLNPQKVFKQKLDHVTLFTELDIVKWFNSVAHTLHKILHESAMKIGLYTAIEYLEKLTDPSDKDLDLNAVIGVYREASRAEEQKDFELYVQIIEFFKKDNLLLIRNIHGEEFLFSFIVEVIVDNMIEVTISTLMTQVLLSEFGQEAFLLDDRIINSLFEKKRAGQFRLSVVEGLFESIKTESDDISSALLLVALFNMAEDNNKDMLRMIAQEGASDNVKIGYLEQYFRDIISFREIKEKLLA
jgi:hypothetical protein